MIPQEKYIKSTKFMVYIYGKKVELAEALRDVATLGTPEFDQMSKTQLLLHFEE